MSEKKRGSSISRRQFMVGASAFAAVGSSVACTGTSSADTEPEAEEYAAASGTYLRRNVANASTQQTLDSYGKAVTAMLQLPPSNPHNWYRQALIHTLDCPHGNWWFLPWHRGYLGWFEQICRKYSGDSTFALPFWDWTAQPFVPQGFIGNALDPTTSIYVDSFATFTTEYRAPFEAYFNSLNASQRQELDDRGFPNFNSLWSALQSYFFPRSQARASTTFNSFTRRAVSLTTVCNALNPKDFITFGSDKATQHSQGVGYGILEGQPHNLVHGNVGGFMGAFLSPVDPIFFGHHGNIDRLWDVWTTKQQAAGGPTTPTAAEGKADWEAEPFLFYFDADGNAITSGTNATSGGYTTIGQFGYTYEDGSATGMSGCATSSFDTGTGGVQPMAATMAATSLGDGRPASGRTRVPPELLMAAAREDGPAFYAEVAIRPPAHDGNVRYHVLVNPPADASALDAESPHYVATLEFFGTPHHFGEATTFLVPLSGTLQNLARADALDAERPLEVKVVADHKGIALKSIDASVESVKLGIF